MYKDRRKKAFLGAAIGLGMNLVGGAISASKKRKAEKKAFEEQQLATLKTEGASMASALTEQASDQTAVDAYRQKIVLKNGGKVTMSNKDSKYKPRGKRDKAFLGKLLGSGAGQGMEGGVGSLVSGMAGGAGNLANAIFSKAPKNNVVAEPTMFKTLASNKNRQTVAPSLPSVMMDGDDELLKPLPTAKMGTKKKLSRRA